MSGLEALLDWFAAGKEAVASAERREECDARLRALPREELFLYVKPIDNSRVPCVAHRRQVAEWVATSMAAAAGALILMATLMVPAMSFRMSHQLESLKQERAALLNELRALRSEEAQLRSAEKLEQYAGERFVAPPPGAVVYAPPAKSTVAALEGRE
ncbi:MAG: hypothetical protein WHT08_08100 [Bryobacteraceae bacterium]